MKHAASNALCFLPASYWFLAWLNLQPLRWGRQVPLKRRSTLNGLYDVISLTTGLFRIIFLQFLLKYFGTFTVHFKQKAALKFYKLF
jgi:hypothetical protein